MMGILVSMGGLVFGFDTGQISGFLDMHDFLERFGELRPNPKDPGGPETWQFTNVRSGLIVGMVSLMYKACKECSGIHQHGADLSLCG